MKGLILFFSGAVAALICVWLTSHDSEHPSHPQKHTFSSFDPATGQAAAVQFDTGMLKLADADLDQVLNLYQEVSARTVIRGSHLGPVKISLHNQAPLTRVETLQLLDTTLADHGITMVLVGDAFIKAVPTSEAPAEVPPTLDANIDELPDSCSYMTCTVAVHHAAPRDIVDALSTVSRMPKSLIYVPKANLLVLRDYSANIRQMLRLVQQLDHPSLRQQLDSLRPNASAVGRQ